MHNGDNIEMFCSDPRRKPNLFQDILNALVFSDEPAAEAPLPGQYGINEGWVSLQSFCVTPPDKRRRRESGEGEPPAARSGPCRSSPLAALMHGKELLAA